MSVYQIMVFLCLSLIYHHCQASNETLHCYSCDSRVDTNCTNMEYLQPIAHYRAQCEEDVIECWTYRFYDSKEREGSPELLAIFRRCGESLEQRNVFRKFGGKLRRCFEDYCNDD